MTALPELQDLFAAALFDPGERRAETLVLGGGRSPQDRIAVYRNNLEHNYREALRAVFGVVERLVGEEFFRHAARSFMRAHRSQHGNLHAYGEAFADFLTGFGPAASLPYLADVARLEWLLHEAFHAGEASPIRVDELAALATTDCADLTARLHPACRLMTSAYQVDLVWEANQPESDGRLALHEKGVRLLVRRPVETTRIESVSAAEFAMLDGCLNAMTLACALAAALAIDASFDVAEFLSRRISDGTLAAIMPASSRDENVMNRGYGREMTSPHWSQDSDSNYSKAAPAWHC